MAELQQAPAARIRAFPARQREAVELLAEGLSYQEIADRMYISASSAKQHICRAMEALEMTGQGRGRLVAAVWQLRLDEAVARERRSRADG